MSNYQDQLLSEVKRSRHTRQNYDSFTFNDDRTQLQASFASLATADISNVQNAPTSNTEWEKAVHDYKIHENSQHPNHDNNHSIAINRVMNVKRKWDPINPYCGKVHRVDIAFIKQTFLN